MTFITRYPAFSIFAGLGVVLTATGLGFLHPARAMLAGFDGAVLVFLILLARRFQRDSAENMRARAARNAPDHHVMLALALIIVAVVLTAVWVELSPTGGRHGPGVGLAVGTLALAWLFANCLFTLHYAHVWYLAASPETAGLEFPGGAANPDYWDFAYFAFVLGMTFQVSDVTITSKRLRRIALLHAMLAFVFNIAVVALSVSLVGAALGA